METFRGKGHLPGGSGVWEIELDGDFKRKEFSVRIPQAGSAAKEWPGLMVQTIAEEEAVFRTRGIPKLSSHWWHVIRGGDRELRVMVLALPDEGGTWPTCTMNLIKI
jgi:hypothetical protein